MSTKAPIETFRLNPHLPETLSVQVFSVSGRFPSEASPATPSEAVAVEDAVRSAVRSLLRWGGHKPSGRGRPASESLSKAADEGRWPTIQPLVDQCNLLSLSSGLPISVLDLAKLQGPFEIRVGEPAEDYIFNSSGQTLSLKGLLLLADDAGPTGSPVKDAQRSKVDASTESFLIVVWGSSAVEASGEMVATELAQWCQVHEAEIHRLTPR